MRTREDLLNDIKDYYYKNNKLPTCRNFTYHNAFTKTFGSWTNAVIESGLIPSKEGKNICLNCQTKTDNPKFCSSRCSAAYSCRNRPPKKTCSTCGKPEKYIYKECKNCRKLAKESNFGKLTMLDIRTKYKGSNRYNYIREYARKIFKDIENKICQKCGYSNHVEICHVKAIASFDDHYTVDEVSNINNIIILCPNCHWLIEHPDCKKSTVSEYRSYKRKTIPTRIKDKLICSICNRYTSRKELICNRCRLLESENIMIKDCLYSGSNKYTYIRERARTKYEDILDKCTKCGYEHHVEVCHIKPISDFEDTDTVGMVNSIDNIIFLCPNCHWELDHDILS